MIEFQGHGKKAKKKLYFKISVFAVLIIAVLLIKPTWNIFQKYLTTRSELEKSKIELKDLKDRESYLKSNLEILESQLGQEREIVRKFDLVKKGEELAIILEPEESEEKPEEKSKLKAFFGKIFGWFSRN